MTVKAKYKALFTKISEMKEEQKLIVTSVIDGKDTFVNLPTGFGKSLNLNFDCKGDNTLRFRHPTTKYDIVARISCKCWKIIHRLTTMYQNTAV